MATVLVTIHLVIVLFLIVVVLLQRSEGGGLGIGGGGGMMTARQASDGLSRTTGILAAVFFATSLGLGILARFDAGPGTVLDRAEQLERTGIDEGGGGILDQLDGEIVSDPAPAAPADVTPAAPAAPADAGGVPTGQ